MRKSIEELMEDRLLEKQDKMFMNERTVDPVESMIKEMADKMTESVRLENKID